MLGGAECLRPRAKGAGLVVVRDGGSSRRSKREVEMAVVVVMRGGRRRTEARAHVTTRADTALCWTGLPPYRIPRGPHAFLSPEPAAPPPAAAAQAAGAHRIAGQRSGIANGPRPPPMKRAAGKSRPQKTSTHACTQTHGRSQTCPHTHTRALSQADGPWPLPSSEPAAKACEACTLGPPHRRRTSAALCAGSALHTRTALDRGFSLQSARGSSPATLRPPVLADSLLTPSSGSPRAPLGSHVQL
jgi:hypothetical protein